MTHREQIRGVLSDKKPLVVGALAENKTLKSPLFECDVVELRLDFIGCGKDVVEFAKNTPAPLLVTARGPVEGGQSDWPTQERADAYRALMPYATLIDIELRDFDSFNDVINQAKNEGVIVVGSFHDFTTTPTLDELTTKFDDRADIHEFALMATTQNHISSHLQIMAAFPDLQLSVMGMGPLGAAARPLMAKAGSLLNYGFLGSTPTAPNQWPASLLRNALAI